MFIFLIKLAYFILDNARCVDKVDKANQELGKFYRDILDTSTDIVFDICVVVVLYNEGGFFHLKDLILNKEEVLPTLDNTRFIATFFSQKKSFTRGYIAASKNYAIFKKALNMIIDVTKQSGGAISDTFRSWILSTRYIWMLGGIRNLSLIYVLHLIMTPSFLPFYYHKNF